MKFLLLFLFFIGVNRAVVAEGIDLEWQKFQKLFNKTYSSIEETERRFSIFKNNLNKISYHNSLHKAGNVSYELGLNQFTDWTAEEFSGFINKFRMKNEINFAKSTPISTLNATIPEFVDWRLKGAVTEIRNQGHCGSCWTFSAVGALEGQAKLALGKFIRLSEQNLLDCADAEYGNYGCNGGSMTGAFVYTMIEGIQSGESYPYVARQGKCKQTSAEIYVSLYQLVPNTEEDLKKAVAIVGPISLGIESTEELQHYSKGVFFDRTCTGRINHGVLAVGYGVENGQDYWLIKNSWGPSWGEQGYFKLARNRYNNCGVADSASYPILEIGKIKKSVAT